MALLWSDAAAARIAAVGVCYTIAAFFTGCGGGAPSPKISGAGNAAKPVTKSAAQKPSTNDASKHVRVDVDGRKWIGDIPYDVFFDDPLAVVSDTSKVAPAPGESQPAPPTETPSTTTAATPSAANGGGSDWKSFIPMEQLQDETKRIRNHLTAALQSQGTYNGNYQELQADGAVIAAIAGIVSQHGEDVSWKANSRFIRDFGLELTESAKALGKTDYTKSQAAADKILAVLDGSLPADAGDPAPTRPFGETANRWGVMKRIEKAKDWLKLEVNTEAKFKADLEKIQKEATLIAAFGKVVADESYDYAAEDDYKQFVQSLIESGREAAAAAKDQAYPKFNEAINKMQKACDQCHLSYGN
jgi:hypothetical protein